MCNDTKKRLSNLGDELGEYPPVLQQGDKADIVILLLRIWLVKGLSLIHKPRVSHIIYTYYVAR